MSSTRVSRTKVTPWRPAPATPQVAESPYATRLAAPPCFPVPPPAGRRKLGTAPARFGRAQQPAALGHFGAQKGFQHAHRLAAANHHPQAPLRHGNASGRGNLLPYLAAAACPSPHLPTLLPRHRDEAEIAHGGTIGLRIAINHDDPQSAADGRQCRGQTNDAGAHDCQIVAGDSRREFRDRGLSHANPRVITPAGAIVNRRPSIIA